LVSRVGGCGGSGGGGGPGAAASQGQGVGPLGKGGPGGAFQNTARLGRCSLPNTHTVYNWFQSTHTVYGWFSIHSYGLYLACTPPQIDNLSEILTSWSHWLGCYTFWLSVVLEIGLMILPPPYCFAVMGRLGAILRVCRGPNQNGNSKVKIVDPCFLGPPVCEHPDETNQNKSVSERRGMQSRKPSTFMHPCDSIRDYIRDCLNDM
jgi:hypothetical protein